MYKVPLLLIKALLVAGIHNCKFWEGPMELSDMCRSGQPTSHILLFLTDQQLMKLMEISQKNEVCNTSI
jgi:hypothetical protein